MKQNYEIEKEKDIHFFKNFLNNEKKHDFKISNLKRIVSKSNSPVKATNPIMLNSLKNVKL